MAAIYGIDLAQPRPSYELLNEAIHSKMKCSKFGCGDRLPLFSKGQ